MIGTSFDFLVGHVNGEQVLIENNPQQITAFIMENQFSDTTITTVLDTLVLTTIVGGFIMNCPDQAFLRELLPVLSPVQMGAEEAPVFVPVKIEEGEDL